MPRKKAKKQKYKFDKYFLLEWKKLYLIVIAWIISVVLHNAVSALFGFEEAVFFVIAVFIIPICFFICFIYTLYRYLVKVYWD